MKSCKRWNRFASVMAALLLGAAAGAAPEAHAQVPVLVPRVEPNPAQYLPDCGGQPVAQGLCLLASVWPPARSEFLVRLVAASGPPPADGKGLPPQKVTLNERLALAPGTYEVYRADGLDDFHAASFVVTAGKVFTLKTATLWFDGGRKLRLQHFMARSNADGVGCEALVNVHGIEAVLPGTYSVALASGQSSSASESGRCRRDGVGFNVVAGKATALGVRALAPQDVLMAKDLPRPHAYRHPSGALALTSVGKFRHEVTHVGLVSGFGSFNGMRNPSDVPVDALVLWGPHFAFAIPMEVNATASCGLSLAQGGLPQRNLLTHCEFDSEGNLTAFRVNARAYFGYTNVNGQSEPTANTINDTVVVKGIRWASNHRKGA